MRQPLWTVGFLLFTLTIGAIAQTDGHSKFEVASIKPTGPDVSGGWFEFPPGGRLNIVNKTLKGMIEFAWDIQPFQIYGGPPWLDSVHYDVVAKPDTNPKAGEIPWMLQSLLVDRFQLTVHHEIRELPIYVLVVANRGKLGPGLTQTREGSCAPAIDPTQPQPQREAGAPLVRRCGSMSVGLSRWSAAGVPIAKLTPTLAQILGRPVVDKTGLAGIFDVGMEWTPDVIQLMTQSMPLSPDMAKPEPSDAAGSAIFTAIREQLGLKLESSRGPVDILIIDRAEKPSEN